MVLKLPSLEYRKTRDDVMKLLKLYMVFTIRKMFLVQAERICWNKRTPFQTIQEGSSYYAQFWY